MIRREQMLRVARGPDSLAQNQRRVVELHHLQGATLAVIARELETSKAAVAGLLHRGSKALRAELENT